MQIKSYLKILGFGMFKDEYGGTLNLAVSEEWTDRIDCLCRFTKIKSWPKTYCVGLNAWALSKIGVASLVTGHKYLLFLAKLNRWNRLMFCMLESYKFRKAKCRFSDFWVGLVKNDSGLLFQETLKSAVS